MSETPRTRLPASVRKRLWQICREAYRAKTGDDPFGKTILFMAMVIAGRKMRRRDVWDFLDGLGASQAPPVSFYQSGAWRALRYGAMRKAGGTCALCGRTRRDGVILHVDHIKPRSKFPELELDPANLQVLCEDCNLGKGNTDAIDWSAE